jgi:hypothetical protein
MDNCYDEYTSQVATGRSFPLRAACPPFLNSLRGGAFYAHFPVDIAAPGCYNKAMLTGEKAPVYLDRDSGAGFVNVDTVLPKIEVHGT